MRVKAVLIAMVSLLAIFAVQARAGDMQKGREVYDMHCVTCHGMNGYAIDMTIPSFANGDRMFLMDQEMLQSVRNGKNMMPAFRGLLSDEEIRDVITYLRTL
ncbi:MAG: cytochrome c [Gammaproteobacteria bacterium]|nr:cytochrome c [Gammaproteobacteria bacterium]